MNKINSHEEAREWLLNKITPTERHNRIGQAVTLGLAGGALGAGAGYLAKKRAVTGMLIGGALGAIGGYAMKPRMTTEDNRRIAQGTLAGFKTFHVIATLPSGQVFHETYKTAEDAKAIAGKLKQNGNKAYVVSSDEYGAKQENRQFGLFKSDREIYAGGVKSWDETNQHLGKLKDKHLNNKVAQAIMKDKATAGSDAVIKRRQDIGQSVGVLAGTGAGIGLGHLAGKGIAGLKSEESYIKEYLSKHPGAKEKDAKEAYQKRLEKFKAGGRVIGGVAGLTLGGYLGQKYGHKQGLKRADALTKEYNKKPFTFK